MIEKKLFSLEFFKASVLGMLAFSTLNPASAQEIVSLSSVNSPYDEQHPVISPSGELYYTLAFHNGNSDPGDVWKSTVSEDQEFQTPVKIPQLSTSGYDVVVGFMDDQNVLVYHDGRDRRQGIHQYRLTDNVWTYKAQLEIGSFRNQSAHFSGRLSPSGEILILSLESFGSYGNEDIYVSFLRDGGKWSAPQNLGPAVNSYQQEMTPYLSADKQWLFFSTNGHGSTQGRDIYYAKRLDQSWENWSAPQPLSEGNTIGAELAYLPLHGESNLAIFTTTQNSEGYGDLQIIQAAIQIPKADAAQPEEIATESSQSLVEITRPMQTPVPESSVPKISEEEALDEKVMAKTIESVEIKRQNVQEPQPVPDPDVTAIDSTKTKEKAAVPALVLTVLDINTLAPIAYAIEMTDFQGATIQVEERAGDQDHFVEDLDSVKEWVITSPGYLPLRIKSPNLDKLYDPIMMTPATKGVSMVLEEVLFKRGTAELLDENSTTLIKSLADFLGDNPRIRILLEGHTDNVGNSQLNKELSLNRASAVRQVLVDHGVDFERIRIAGWGGTKPIASNQTEEGRVKNRRVEMVIVAQ